MDLHFCEALTLSELAAAVHVSPGYLSRFFRQKTGRTVMETIAGKKIEYARQLLDEGNLKVFEVARRVGFEDTTYFSHVFKKYTGMSAKEISDARAQRRKSARRRKKRPDIHQTGEPSRLPAFSLFCQIRPAVFMQFMQLGQKWSKNHKWT